MPLRRNFADGDDQVARRDRIVVHLPAVGEGWPARSARYSLQAARRSISARTGLPLLRPSCVSRMSKCASSVISPTFSSGSPRPSTPGRVTALLPPTSNVSSCTEVLNRTASRIGSVACSMVMPDDFDIAAVGDVGRNLAPGLDVVAADPPQRLPEQRRRQIARPRRHRSGRKRRSDQPDCCAGVARDQKLGKIGPAAHAFAVARAVA